MHRSKDMPEYDPNLDDVYMDIVLEAGDILYLPRGWWHDPVPVGEETVHLAVGVFPAYVNNYLTWIAQNMVEKKLPEPLYLIMKLTKYFLKNWQIKLQNT